MTASVSLHRIMCCLDVTLSDVTPDLLVDTIEHDSRQPFGEQTLYVCLADSEAQASAYIQQALSQRPVAVLTSVAVLAKPTDPIPILCLPGLRQQLTKLFAAVYQVDLDDHQFIAVTGTNGKTSVAHYLSQALSAYYVGTLGIGTSDGMRVTANTTPLLPEILKDLCPLMHGNQSPVVLEASSHALAQDRLMTLPITTAVFTNLTQEHLDYHGTMVAYADSKFRLFHRSQVSQAVVNVDDEWGKKLVRGLRSDIRLLTTGVTSDAAIYPKKYDCDSQGIVADLHTPLGPLVCRVPLIGAFNLYNLMAVVGVLLMCWGDLSVIEHKLSALVPVAGRMERSQGDGRFVIDYAHTPDALAKALQALRALTSGRLWCLFGCGGDRDKTKRSQMGNIAYTEADVVVITNDNPRQESPQAIIDDILAGIADPASVIVIPDRKEAVRYCYQHAAENDHVLVAGKGHEDYQIIGNRYISYSDKSWIEQLGNNTSLP